MKKKLNIFDLLVIAFGAMIGWGWVVSTGSWIKDGGVIGTVIGFFVAGLMIFFVGLVYSELTTSIPVTGGERVFSLRAFGPTVSFSCTWFLILSYVGVVCFEAVSLPTILQYIFPQIGDKVLYNIAGFDVSLYWLLISIGFSLLIGLINFIGIKKSAIVQKILTIFIAVVGIVVMISAAAKGQADNISSQMFVSGSSSNGFGGVLKIICVAPFFLFGFDVIPQTAGEIKIPAKKIGTVMLVSIVMAVLFYVGIVLSVGSIFSSSEITTSLNGSGLVTADAMAKVFNSRGMAIFLIVGGLFGIITSWNSFLIGGSRALYSMSDANFLPRSFAKIHKKYNSPYLPVALITLISIIAAFFGRTMLTWIVDSATFACAIAYLIVSLSFIVLRKKEPELNRPFKIKHYKIVGVLAVVMCFAIIALYIIPNTGVTLVWQEWIIVGAWLVLGLIFYIVQKKKSGKKFGYSEEDIRLISESRKSYEN